MSKTRKAGRRVSKIGGRKRRGTKRRGTKRRVKRRVGSKRRRGGMARVLSRAAVPALFTYLATKKSKRHGSKRRRGGVKRRR